MAAPVRHFSFALALGVISCAAMGKKPNITIVGPGRLGSALTFSLVQAGYQIDELVSRERAESLRRARQIAGKLHSKANTLSRAKLESSVVWICVGDSAIRGCAETLARREDLLWKGKLVFHSSGALSSDELSPLRKCGASVASVHPMMSFVHAAKPSLAGVTFALEGDSAAIRAARKIVRDLKGEVISIAKADKVLYHAWGGFSSPLIIAELAMADLVAKQIGLSPAKARKTLAPILRQTVENYIAHGSAAAFSGPLVRGDVATIARHLEALKAVPQAREVYLSLARAALDQLPVGNAKEMRKALADK